ncbi:unnamed protein product [Clonostachys byssicola]|uniref:Xylanolytic transcriptional activator regulatory domain-containing protein n=1 Tax=Clonostachys byssicola TaxID=160290 RepID=A0A9N9XZQ9_9HYPO|nr:unnamed protein product [Clonostachys byssicola]
MPPRKVNNACARCRKQKLKAGYRLKPAARCDIERPCLLCTRAGVECIAPQARSWAEYTPTEYSRRLRRGAKTEGRGRKSRRDTIQVQRRDEPPPEEATLATGGTVSAPHDIRDLEPSDQYALGNSSSTIMLVEEVRWVGLETRAFQQHDCASPEMAEKSALCYSQASKSLDSHADTETRRLPPMSVYSRNGRPKVSQAAIRELSKLLPSREICYLLVDNYFDKIHWYMLLFHQHKFRGALDSLYPNTSSTAPATGQQDESTAGYISVLLVVCALSLRYTSTTQREQLAKHGVNAESLRESILNTLRLRLLNILSLGSLEAVQLCVLLGGYYLYHGEPELAWPLCGCALRLAQALELHRRPVPGMASQHETEVRKRCWWAVHEIETYCSMIYGFPLNMSDSDCNTEPLDPSDQWSIAADGQPSSSRQPTLLVYKCSMSALSKIIKSALEHLYRSRQKQQRSRISATQNETPMRVQFISNKIKALNTELVEWYDDLPPKLKMGRLSGLPVSEAGGDLANPTPSHISFDEKLFKLQALALKLAFENARILIHRPLLLRKDGEKRRSPPSTTIPTAPSSPESLSAYSRTCHDAALQISWAGQRRIFRDASTTYALNFIALHLLTAGVTLGIMTSLNPLSQESFEAKLGIRRIMEMQVSLKPDSIVADQGLQILRKLFLLVMKKETHSMLDFGPQGQRVDERASVQESQDRDNLPTGLGVSSENQVQAIQSGAQSGHFPIADQSSDMDTGFQRDTSTQSVPYELCQPTSQSPISGAMLAVEQAALALFFLYNTAWNLPQFDLVNHEPAMTTITGLKLSLSHTPGSSPPEIVATVTNDNAFPVSILKYESPLDPLVLALGKLQLTPAGADAPLDLPKIAVRRVWPPTRDQLVTLEPGQSQQNPVPLREQVVPPSDLVGEVSIELKGRWQAVWSKRKEDIDDSSLENPNISPEVERGEYATGKVKVHF